jgi:mannose-6-phosphate isomerase-like protein (cupin superfamily)
MVYRGQRIENPITGQTMIFLEMGEDTNGEVFKMEGIFRPGGFAGPVHVHPFQEERFAVTQGTAGFKVGGKRLQLGPGERIVVPAGRPHTFWNAGTDEMRVEMEFRPALAAATGQFYEFYFGLAQAGMAGKNGLPSIWQIALQAEQFSDHVRLVSPPWAVQRMTFAILKPIARLLGYRPFIPQQPWVPVRQREQARD